MPLVLKGVVNTLSRNNYLIQRNEGCLDYQALAVVLSRKDCQSDFHRPLHGTKKLHTCSIPIRDVLCGGLMIIIKLNIAYVKCLS